MIQAHNPQDLDNPFLRMICSYHDNSSRYNFSVRPRTADQDTKVCSRDLSTSISSRSCWSTAPSRSRFWGLASSTNPSH